jgi:isoleucyl-tRNA synthetase
VPLVEGEYTLETVVADDDGSAHRAVAVLPGGGFVVLDTEVDDELAAEGWARDVVREVQDARKAAGLHVSDAILLRLTVPADRQEWAERHLDLVTGETLAREVEVTASGETLVVVVERLA